MSNKHKTSSEDLRRVGGMSYLNPNAPEPWASFVEQIERVKPHLGHLAKWIETMKHPKRILIVDVPIQLDNGTVAHYEGYRVQHNNALGPYKGGLRYHPTVDIDSAREGSVRVDPAPLLWTQEGWGPPGR